tara:strand:+ start:637 stop:1545 length:909 start_codon:yes stop_codon:yes gene_type:complete
MENDNKLKACITYISSRKACIQQSLKALWENYNIKHDYPVYVFYFDDIYDSEEFRQMIANETPQNVNFVSIPYETPAHIPEDQLFYNRQDVWYVRTQFPISRKGYLHMCHFMSNYYGYPNTEFEKYDYTMSVDDESMFVKPMTYDPFEVMKNQSEPMGALKVYDQTKKIPHQGNFDTRINLWKFVKGYLKHYNVEPKSEFMKNLLSDPEADKNFHFYPCADSYVVKISMFETPEWKQWINAVNQYGGIYKYRWGDNDVNSLFYLIHHGDNIHDLKTVDEGYHSQGALRHLCDYAPGVKDNSK